MNEHLRERIIRKLESLADERGYQVLDYVEFLESRYAERSAASSSPFTRFTEAVEDRLRAGKVSATTIAEAMNMMNKATGLLSGALAAGRSVANDIVTATRTSSGSMGSPGAVTPAAPAPTAAAPATAPPPTGDEARTAEASSTAHDIKMPGSGEEKL